MDMYSSSIRPKQLVILLGQMHTVWKGSRIGNTERKQIVACQARLCEYYAYFYQYHDVQSFGTEGMYEGLDLHFSQRKSAGQYQVVEKELGVKHPLPVERLGAVAREMLSVLGKRWHTALRGSDLHLTQELAAAVSGQHLFHYLSDGKATGFAIEGESAYQEVLQGITHLGDQISKLEHTPEFRYVQQRGGKVQTNAEAQVVSQYNALVKEFNRLIGSDIRERATLELVKQKAPSEPLLIYTMGVGHRKNYLELVDEVLKDTEIAFVFVTPPELLVNWWRRVGVLILIVLGLVLLNGWLGGV